MATISVSVQMPENPQGAWDKASALERFDEWMTIHGGWCSPPPNKVGKGKPLHDGPGDEWNAAWADYRGEVFAPWVVRQLARRYPAEMAAPRDEDSCDYRDPEVWKFPAWYVTPKGIHLAASFARVARACDDPDWAVLPWPVVDTHRGAVRLH